LYPHEDEADEVRQGFNPDAPETKVQEQSHDLGEPPDPIQGASEVQGSDQTGAEQPWEERRYGDFEDEREVWKR
jgi:hypothetical protein